LDLEGLPFNVSIGTKLESVKERFTCNLEVD
jgi:hypothetical protein